MTSAPQTDLGSAPQRALLFVLAVAGLAGASGVALAAVAAHKVDSPALATAATMLMIHAGSVVGLVAVGLRTANPRAWTAVAAFMLAAVCLFSGDIALHTLTGNHIFPMAAPTGGSLLIASWVIVALLAIISARRSR